MKNVKDSMLTNFYEIQEDLYENKKEIENEILYQPTKVVFLTSSFDSYIPQMKTLEIEQTE